MKTLFCKPTVAAALAILTLGATTMAYAGSCSNASLKGPVRPNHLGRDSACPRGRAASKRYRHDHFQWERSLYAKGLRGD
jgi:hypothetical protein